jgi:hypothetical protein
MHDASPSSPMGREGFGVSIAVDQNIEKEVHHKMIPG